MKLVLPERVRACGDGTLRLEEVGHSTHDMNANFPESMSGGLNRLPPEPRQTLPNPCAQKYCQSKCIPAHQRLVWILLEFVLYTYVQDVIWPTSNYFQSSKFSDKYAVHSCISAGLFCRGGYFILTIEWYKELFQ